MKLEDKLKQTIQKLNENNIEDSNLKAKLLISYILKIKKEQLLINSQKELELDEIIRIDNLTQELIKGVPIQYIKHKQEFMGLEFYVDENVLIPQPDTEILVENAIKYINIKNNVSNKSIKILDLCTGSGCISISIAKLIAKDIKLEIFSTDISKSALKIAKKNAKNNNVLEKIKFINSNMFEALNESFDIILSNPPYIETEKIKTLSKEVQSEPHIALDGGEDGLKFYKIISENAYKYLKDEGILIIEIGYNQKNKVIDLLEKTKKYIKINCIKDYSKNDRIIIAKKV